MKRESMPVSSVALYVPRSTLGVLSGLLLAAAVLLVAWSLVVPIFEAPDEPAHWEYARYLHDEHRLPAFGQLVEANYPPLFFLLVAPVAARSALPARSASADGRTMPFPPRFFRNAADDFTRYWPLREARLISALLSVLTVLFCYLAGREATGRVETGLLVGGVVAFLPQFTFRGMNISDDVLVTLMAAMTTYLLVRMLRRGFIWPVALAAAAAMAGALLAKISAGFLPVPFVLAILSERASWRARLVRLTALGLSLALIAPWVIRNVILYADLFATREVLAVIPDQIERRPPTSPYFVTAFPLHLTKSFIGDFGWQNLGLPYWMYGLFIGLMVAASWGVWRYFRQSGATARLTLVVLTIPLLNLAVVVYVNLTLTNWQGRYLFPALPAIALLAGLGLECLPRWSARLAMLTVTGLALLNVAILGLVVYPAYWPPPPV
ncbi:MAG TPA: glycosyltransferase family 39 protein [Thermomicrobiales bacterium]|nr:glycosyltransferase family 39 protein [Thermomicrobiales bacterium]